MSRQGKAADFSGILPHSLPGFFKGMRIEYLSKILGHSKISTTEKYAHVLPSDLHDAMQNLAL